VPWSFIPFFHSWHVCLLFSKSVSSSGVPLAKLSLSGLLRICPLHSAGSAWCVIRFQAVTNLFWDPTLFLRVRFFLSAAPYNQALTHV
jgi:hypothetical protein